jgi:hypothetical protein
VRFFNLVLSLFCGSLSSLCIALRKLLCGFGADAFNHPHQIIGRAGTVIRQDGEFFAFDADGECLGTFDTMLEATRKIPRARREPTP